MLCLLTNLLKTLQNFVMTGQGNERSVVMYISVVGATIAKEHVYTVSE
jgi:hypothetical protein